MADGAFSEFAQTADAVAATSKKLAKAALLQSYFAGLGDADLARAARFFAGQVPSPDFKSALTVPAGLRNYRSDIEEQTRFTMQILTEQLEANETDWAHCHHVRLYLTEPRRDYRAFARVWREYFPDPAKAPALAFVPSTGIMFEGPVIEIDPSGVMR